MRQLLADPSRLRDRLPLLGVLVLALALRVWGLTWGLPSATHYFSYHPDESVVLGTASGMSVFGGQLLPHYYDYGSLQFYLVCFANTLAALFGYVDIVPKNFSVWYPEWAKMYLVGRLLSVGMGIGTVWIVYAIGQRLWGRRAGLFAALTLAIMPLHVQHSHFLTVDVPGTFWATLSLLWAVRLATGGHKPLWAALVAGLCTGLAAATKYNLALAILPVLAACMVRPSSSIATPGTSAKPFPTGKGGELTSRFGFLLAALTAFVLAFFAACPGAILENKTFLEGVSFEAVHVQNVNDPTFRNTGNGFVYPITHNLDAGLGLPLLVLALVSVGYALFRREHGDGLLAAFALPYYMLISLAAVRYARYTIPLLPILALWAGRMLGDWDRAPEFSKPWMLSSVGIAVFGLTFFTTADLIGPMGNIDPRDKAYAWLQSKGPASSVGFATQPWFGTVPVSPYFSMPKPGIWREPTSPDIAKRIVYSGTDWDVQALNTQKPDFVALSEYDYDNALRLNDPAAHAYLAAVTRDYTRTIIVPEEYRRQSDFPSSGLPHDMLYTNPIISIYQRKQ